MPLPTKLPEALCFRVFVHACVHVWVRCEQTLLARYLLYLLMEYHPTFTINRLWGKDERVKFWSQKVNGKGHNRVKCAP